MFDHEMDQLGKVGRVAVAATCLEHVLDFYRRGNFVLRARHAPADTGAPPDKDLVEHAIDVAWTFVATGQGDPAILDAVSEGLVQPPDGAEVDDMSTAGSTVVGAASRMMKAFTDATPHSGVDALRSCSSAVWDGVLTATSDNARGKAACAEEEAWQKRVVDRALQRPGSSLARSDFADLLALPLSWHQHLSEYEAQGR